MRVVRLSAYALAAFTHQEIFLVLISVRGWVDLRAIVRLEGFMSMTISNDTMGKRTHDLPACSAVPQPTDQLHHHMLHSQRKSL